MANRSYRPGARRTDLDPHGLMSEGRWAWVRTAIGQFVILVDGDESAPTVILLHPTKGKYPIKLNLTALTADELKKMRELFNAAFDWAEQSCRLRDQAAEEAFNAGDDSHARVYRQVPQLVFRKRPVEQHGEGLRFRFEGLPQGDRRGYRDDGGVRGAGDELAEPDSPGSSTQDNGKASD